MKITKINDMILSWEKGIDEITTDINYMRDDDGKAIESGKVNYELSRLIDQFDDFAGTVRNIWGK